jgi:hypothetical protein
MCCLWRQIKCTTHSLHSTYSFSQYTTTTTTEPFSFVTLLLSHITTTLQHVFPANQCHITLNVTLCSCFFLPILVFLCYMSRFFLPMYITLLFLCLFDSQCFVTQPTTYFFLLCGVLTRNFTHKVDKWNNQGSNSDPLHI